MSETVESLDEWLESIEDAEGGTVLIFDEAAGTRPDGKVDLSLQLCRDRVMGLSERLALRLEGHGDKER